MYEEITYERILGRMLERVPADMDKREGAIIYDALAPAAVELQNLYIQLDVILNESFADTQTRAYLIKRAAERGISPSTATYAIRQGEFSMDVEIGARFSLNALNYVVTERMAHGIFQLQCESLGEVGNREAGDLIPIEYIEGLTDARLTEVLIPGEDEEDTELFRARYFQSLDSQAFGGNRADYKDKVNALEGVGGVKVYPVWKGGGTVRLVFIDSLFDTPSKTLLNAVQTATDPVQNQGMGVGFAPIGHVVTVEGCQAVRVDIRTRITFQDGWSWEEIEPYAMEVVDTYFKELAAAWAKSDRLVVRISQLETRMLEIPGVLDIGDTRLNGEEKNFTLDADSVPVRGSVGYE